MDLKIRWCLTLANLLNRLNERLILLNDDINWLVTKVNQTIDEDKSLDAAIRDASNLLDSCHRKLRNIRNSYLEKKEISE